MNSVQIKKEIRQDFKNRNLYCHYYQIVDKYLSENILNYSREKSEYMFDFLKALIENGVINSKPMDGRHWVLAFTHFFHIVRHTFQNAIFPLCFEEQQRELCVNLYNKLIGRNKKQIFTEAEKRKFTDVFYNHPSISTYYFLI